MPAYKNHTAIELVRGIKAFFTLEVGIGRQRLQPKRNRQQKNVQSSTDLRGQAQPLQPERNKQQNNTSVNPENIVWIFGQRRTGSTWLSEMMGDFKGQTVWHEPYVGEIFGVAYARAWDWQRRRKDFAMADRYRDVWLKSIRSFVLDGARARFPRVSKNEYLIIKDPHGSIGAPLMMEALPESRMIFLIRDPRDIVASCLDADRKASWTSQLRGDEENGSSHAEENPEAYTKQQAEMTQMVLSEVKRSFEEHKGPKVLVRYEDLRHSAFSELERIYSTLSIPLGSEELRHVVNKYDWTNVPEEQKGVGKARRKATPGGWQEDLSAKQVTIVEEITAPILEEFYQS